MIRGCVTRLSAGDLAGTLADVPELAGAVGPSGADEPWVDAAIRRWGCCGIAVLREERPVAVVLAAPSLHAPAWHPVTAVARRGPGSAVQIASWADHDDVRSGRLASSAMAAALVPARIARLESAVCRFPSAPRAERPSPRWLTGCGFGRVDAELYALDVSATTLWRVGAAVRWVNALPGHVRAPRPASQGQTGRSARSSTPA